MPLSTIYKMSATKFNGTTSYTFSEAESRTFNSNLATITNRGSGELYNTFAAVMNAAPVININTKEIARVFTAMGLAGTGIGADGTDTYTSIDFYWAAVQNKGARKSGANHFKGNCAFAFAVPKSVKCSNNGEASVDFDVYLGSTTGTGSPVTFSSSVALLTQTVSEKFTLGKVVANGSTLEVSEVTINFNPAVEQKFSSGDYYPTNIHLAKVDPTIELKLYDVGAISTYGLSGTAVNASNFDLYLRSISQNGLRIADATTAHVRFRVNNGAGMYVSGNVASSGTSDSMYDLKVLATYDGTNLPVTIATGVAIP